MNKEMIYCILTDCGYHEIESKNKLMRSFSNLDKRINVYNTGTVQMQSFHDSYVRGVLKNDFSEEELLKLLK